MEAYYYSGKTGEYICVLYAMEDPEVEGRVIMPPDTTLTPPPECGEKQVAVWDGEAWAIKEDHRRHMDATGHYVGGTPYWLPGDTWKDEPRYMTTIGPLPEGATTVCPQKTEQEIQAENLQNTIYESEAYLNSTDYRVLKFMDKYISTHPEVLAEFEAEYPDTLVKRQEARDKINGAQASAQIAGINLDEQYLLV